MTRPLDLSLCFVSDPSARLGVIETALAAAQGGSSMVQLRDKTMPDAEFVALGRALKAALDPLKIPLIVNDRVALVAAIGAAGAHVGQSDLSASKARAILGPDAILGLSIEAAPQLHAVPNGVDYLGVGPLKPTDTKADAAPALGFDGMAQICAATALPCIAIGGMSADDAAPVKAAGGKGLAVVSAICGAENPEAAARAIATAWRDA